MSIYTPFSVHTFFVGMVRTALLSVLVIPFFTPCTHAQAGFDTKGKDFWLTFPPNYHDDANQNDSLYIFITATEPTTGVIAYRNRNGTSFSRSFTITNPLQVYTFRLSWVEYELQGIAMLGEFNTNHQSGRIAPQSFSIKSDKDITVSALNRAKTTSDGMLVLPTDILGTSYRVMAYNSDGRNDGSGFVDWKSSSPSQLALVATRNNTIVTITPSAPVVGPPAPTTITLKEGDVYLLQASITPNNLRGDLTGTLIESSEPIAVFGSHQRSLLPIAQNPLSSRNFLVEQMIPISAWGTSHILTPFPSPRSVSEAPTDIFRVLAAYDNTILIIDGIPPIMLQAGEYYEAPLTSAFLLASSKEVLVAQYKGSSTLQNGSTSNPFMMIIPPQRQFSSSYLCNSAQASVDREAVYSEQFCTIVCPTDSIHTIRIDGKRVQAKIFRAIAKTCYSYAWIPITSGAHIVEARAAMGLYMYGYSPAESYGYPGGMDLNAFTGEPIAAGTDTLICVGDSVQLFATGGVSYQWWPAAGLSCSNCPNPVAKPLVPTLYSVIIKNGLGCTYTRMVNVNAQPYPTPSVSNDTAICAGKEVQLRASGGTLYTWSPADGLSCTNCPNPVAKPTQTTTYKVLVSNGGSCSTEDSVTVDIMPVPFALLPDDTLMCAQDSIVFNLPDDVAYNWSPSAGLSCTDCPNPTAKPKKTTTYHIIMTNKAGCTGYKKMTITVANLPIVSLTPNAILCNDNLPIRLLAKGGNFYHWSPADGLSCTDCASPLANPTKTTTYTVDISITTSSSCQATTTITITVLPAPTLTLTPDTTLCTGTPLQLQATGGNSYHWSPPDGLSCSDCPNPIATTTATTTYTVTATNTAGCSATDSIRITILQLADVGISPDLTLCAGSSATLLATGGNAYSWSPTTGLSCADCPNPTAQPTTTTTYTVVIAGTKCTEQRVVTLTVVPQPNLALSPDTSICRTGEAQLRASGATTYAWSPTTGLSCSDCPNPIAKPVTSTRYHVTASNGNGCARTNSVLVTVRPCGLQVKLSSLNFPPLALCDSAMGTATLTNTGKEPIEIRSWQFTGRDANAFSAELLGAVAPYALAVQDSVHFRIHFRPMREDSLGANFVIKTHVDDFLISNTCTGKSYRSTAQFTLGQDVLAEPGKTLEFDLYAESSMWQDMAVDSLHFSIGYKTSWLQYAQAIQPKAALPFGWSIQARELPGSTPTEKVLFITAGGTQPMQVSGILATVSLLPLLSDELIYTPTLQVQAIGRETCVATSGKAATIKLAGCATQLRSIRYYGTDYQFAITGSAQSTQIPIQYSIGLAAPVRVEIYNHFGRLVATHERGMVQPGVHSDMLNTAQLAAGMYIIRFSSGPFSQSIPMLLGIE